jgi:hypothetical protein
LFVNVAPLKDHVFYAIPFSHGGRMMRNHLNRIGLNVLIGLFLTILTCTAVFAQNTAQINGSVKDQTGAVLPGVEVTATQTDTGVVRNAVSDETGAFYQTCQLDRID